MSCNEPDTKKGTDKKLASVFITKIDWLFFLFALFRCITVSIYCHRQVPSQQMVLVLFLRAKWLKKRKEVETKDHKIRGKKGDWKKEKIGLWLGEWSEPISEKVEIDRRSSTHEGQRNIFRSSRAKKGVTRVLTFIYISFPAFIRKKDKKLAKKKETITRKLIDSLIYPL